MKKTILVLLSILLFLTLNNVAFSQRLINAISDKQISIDSSFKGGKLSFFGNIEPEIGASDKIIDGSYNIIVVISGPALNRVARKKNKQWGIWINTQKQSFGKFPSFYWVLSNAKLVDIVSEKTLKENYLLPKYQPSRSLNQQADISTKFGDELVRLMEDDGMFGTSENAIKFHSNSFYSGRLSFPDNVPVGNYLSETYLFKNGEILFKRSEAFSVRKTGFERFLGNFAKQSPFLYGVFAVILALFTGWLGGVAFRR